MHLCVSERIVFLICVPTGSGYSRCVVLGPPAAASSWDPVLTSAFRCTTLPITHITELVPDIEPEPENAVETFLCVCVCVCVCVIVLNILEC